MLLEDLIKIEGVITAFRNSESCANMMMEGECEKAINILNREIELKTMDPRKSKIDVQGNEMDGD